MDWTMPNAAHCMSMDEDPKLTKGNGMPVMGMRPMHMPTSSSSWKVHMPTMPMQASCRKSESD